MVTAVIALYFNVFVLIVQSFEKLSFLNPAAPKVGPPFAEPNSQFAVAQGVTLVILVMLADYRVSNLTAAVAGTVRT